MVHETVTMEGHLIDSDILRRAFARIVEGGGEFEVEEFRVGKRNDDASFVRLSVTAADAAALDGILEDLNYLGASAVVADAQRAPAEADGILPDEFYSTTNYDTFVRLSGRWEPVRDQRMDCALVLRDGAPTCVKQGQVKKGEPVVLRGPGIRVKPPERSRDFSVFGFMSNDISAEINKGIVISGAAREMRKARDAGEKIVVVAGPAIVHSGGDAPLARLVRDGWVDVLLDRERVRHARPREVDPEDEPRHLPDERPGDGGRQPEPPLGHQRGEPYGRHTAGGGERPRDLGRDVRGREEGHPVRAGRLHPRRRAAQGRGHGRRGGAESLRRGAARARGCA